ncbi:MAG: SGNH/GDSL hydrolase family protein [Planctomycetaceae bacterium]
MSRMAFHFAGGDAFFAGLLLILAAVLGSISGGKRRFIKVRTLSALLGAVVIAFSATPLPDWAYIVSGIAVFLWFYLFLRPADPVPETSEICPPESEEDDDDELPEDELFEATVAEDYPPPETPRALRLMSLAVAVNCFVAFAWEIPFRGTPLLGERQHSRIAVIGDSISAGLLGPEKETTWPRQFQERYHIPVINVSREGATAASALKQADLVNPDVTLVLVEIGGNDLLGSTTPAQFATDLERLLATLDLKGRQIVMLELPLPPLYNRFGQAQRELAHRYDVALISRRDFAEVLAAHDATLDGLHLSEQGHRLMAEMIWRHLGSNLTPDHRDQP